MIPEGDPLPERGGLGLDAQWSDDFHHAVHALLTDEKPGLLSGLWPDRTSGSALCGRASCPSATTRRFGAGGTAWRPREEPELSLCWFIPQNHDQVGKTSHAISERLSQLVPFDASKTGGRDGAAVAVCAAAVHGRGVRRDGLVSVLHPSRQSRDWWRRSAVGGARSSRPSTGKERCSIRRAEGTYPPGAARSTFWRQASAASCVLRDFYKLLLQMRKSHAQPLSARGGHGQQEVSDAFDRQRVVVVRYAGTGRGNACCSSNYGIHPTTGLFRSLRRLDQAARLLRTAGTARTRRRASRSRSFRWPVDADASSSLGGAVYSLGGLV